MRLIVNREEHELTLQGNETLLAVLRERLQLTGTKLGCGRGECGACTVLVEGRLAYSCLTLAAGCAGQPVTTIEGLGTSEDLHPLQRSFMELDALQCGFCTPGQLMAAAALLSGERDPDEEQVRHAMSGNLCRCGTYPKIVRAVQAAAATLRADAAS
ncbi:MAG: (2Fe-2S)-binding protein [Gemmatimonadota bacterium]|nr:(2Fe-2S)-binding protein [Gemmatimonadota bacterium]